MAIYNFNQAQDLDSLKRMMQEVAERRGLFEDTSAEISNGFPVWGAISPYVMVTPGMLVHQSNGVVIPADQTVLARWAVGVCQAVSGNKAAHTPLAHLESLPVAGTVTQSKLIFLGTHGGATFDEPTGGSNTILRQNVGRAIKSIRNNLYEVVINITPESVV
jgi:hypothetical protein